MKPTLFVACFFVMTATVAVMGQAPSIKTTTDAWLVEYEKATMPLSDSDSWTLEMICLERKKKDAKATVYIDMVFNLEMQLFVVAQDEILNEDANYCRLITGLDVKKKLEAMFLNPTLLQEMISVELGDAAEEFLKKPGNSLVDAEWQEIAARVETAVKVEFETEMKPSILQTIVIDTSAENEIALLGGVKASLYPHVADPERLRLFMASMQTLAKTAIRELKESQKLSESTQKQLDALAGLTPEQYGMTK